MKLSEAIRLGAMIRPQCSGRLFRANKSCSLGAALEATGTPYQVGLEDGHLYSRVKQQWPWVTDDYLFKIYRKNDIDYHGGHKDVRGRVAAYVATVEPQEEDSDALRDSTEVQEMDVSHSGDRGERSPTPTTA